MIGYEVFILLLAGLGAGIITGLLGASAALIAAPLMIIFLGYDAFTAIGISLVIDVFASGVTAYNFNKRDRLRIKPALLILFFAVVGAFVGSYFSSSFQTELLSKFMGITVFLTGIHLIRRNVKKEATFFEENLTFKKKIIKLSMLIFLGFVVGFVAGIVGLGGGIGLLFVLTILLGYRIHPAIGTSVFIMAFITLSGAVGHFVYGKFLIYPIIIASVAGIIGAFFSSKMATLTSEVKLNRIVGVILFLLGLFLLLQQIFVYTGIT